MDFSNKMATKYTHWLPWMLFILGSLFYCYASIIEIIPNNIANDLITSFHLNATQVSVLGTSYFIAYALCLIPGGAALDRWGERKILPLAILFCSSGTLLFALATHFPMAIAYRMLSGMGSSFGLMGAMFLVNKWLPKQYFGLMIGLTVMVGLGGGLLQQPFALLVAHWGWRMTLSVLALAGLLLAGLFYLTARKTPSIKLNTTQTNIAVLHTLWISIQPIMCKRANWLLALFGGFMFIPTSILGDLWGINYLQTYYPQYSRPLLAAVNSLLFLGWIIGSPLLGWLSDYIKKRSLIIKFSSLGLLIVLLAMVYLPFLNLLLIGVLLFFAGICSAGGAMFFTMTIDSNATAATSLGFVNALALIPTIFFQPLFGYVLDKYAIKMTGQHIYSLVAYQHAFGLLVAIIILATYLAWFSIKETFPTKNELL